MGTGTWGLLGLTSQGRVGGKGVRVGTGTWGLLGLTS